MFSCLLFRADSWPFSLLWVYPGVQLNDREEIDVFTDPQSVTYATVAKSLPAISRGESASSYRLNDSGVVYDLTLSHQFAKRNRAVARLKRDVYAADALVPTQFALASMTATLTMDFPTTGYTASDARDLANALTAFLTSANLLKLANGET
jgi:hypothetical protein